MIGRKRETGVETESVIAQVETEIEIVIDGMNGHETETLEAVRGKT
jgi:hypothetical protein